MKIKTSTGVVILVVFAGFAFWAFMPSAGGTSAPLSAATGALVNAVKGPQPIRIKETIRIEAGKGKSLSFEFPKTPGRLYGHWSASGVSTQIKGATDDTLVAFKLVGPNNESLQNLDHLTSGNFDIHITSPGRYTFTLDNAGILRASDRVVEIEATYKPD